MKVALIIVLVATVLFWWGYQNHQPYLQKTVITPTLTPDLSTPTPLPTVTPTVVKKDNLILDVPFTVQAPFAEWKDPQQQDACEEASVLMVMHWVKNAPILGKQAAKDEILSISQYEQNTYGSSRDTSAQDTATRIIQGYYHYTNYKVQNISSPEDIIDAIEKGNGVIVPANGQLLHNPNFTPPGPERHMVVIKGFDRPSSVFITNDTGISQGENWKYDFNVLFNAIRDYPTGDHVSITDNRKIMIIISHAK